MERSIQHQIAEEIVFSNSNLLIRTFLLMDGDLQSLERLEGYGPQEGTATEYDQ